MLKMFQAERAPGGSADFWDESWSAQTLAAVLDNPAVCENDPLLPLFREKLQRDRLFLEGGCGQAQWVKYFSDRGQRAVGIDFAERTVAAVRRHAPTLDIRVGDVLALPFADGEVHTYYSGGVVEHFEGGPLPALAEARRVLARDGWLLCSVPDESTLRRWLYRGAEVRRPDLDPALVVRRVDATAQETPPAGMAFFQYCFSEHEFRALLTRAGFDVERSFGCGMLWGLMEVPHAGALYQTVLQARRRLHRRTGESLPVSREPAAATLPSLRDHDPGRPGWAKRALVLEDPSVPIVGRGLQRLRERCANMRMFVAKPRR